MRVTLTTPPPITVLAAMSGRTAGTIVENLAPARNQSPPALDTPILRNLISGFHWASAGTSGTRASRTTRATAIVLIMRVLPGEQARVPGDFPSAGPWLSSGDACQDKRLRRSH